MLVTGGSRGIGAAVARAAARAGWAVCLTYREDAAAAAAVVADTEAAGGIACAVQGDVALEADVLRAFATADGLGRLVGVVANAGITGPASRLDELTAERIQRILAVNVLGTMLTCREAVRRLSRRHGGAGGSIVLMSSAAARLGGSGEWTDYAASKGAIDTLAWGLAREVAAEGVRVNAIRPGVIETDIHAAGGQPDRVARLERMIPMQRPGSTDEVAATVIWLLGDDASYTTGAVIDVTGGR